MITRPPNPSWTFDEFAQLAVDFADPAQVADYDRRQGDGSAEDRATLASLSLPPDPVVIDIGCGTGSFAIQAALAGAAHVHAVDVSQPMLDFVNGRAKSLSLAGRLTTHHAGFLSYDHAGPPADLVSSQFALHHLPDFWKSIALTRIASFIKPGGRFHLTDVVFSFPPADHARHIDAWIDAVSSQPDSFSRADLEGHIRAEFSTYDWILEPLLTRAGLRIDQADKPFPTRATYLCTKVATR